MAQMYHRLRVRYLSNISVCLNSDQISGIVPGFAVRDSTLVAIAIAVAIRLVHLYDRSCVPCWLNPRWQDRSIVSVSNALACRSSRPERAPAGQMSVSAATSGDRTTSSAAIVMLFDGSDIDRNNLRLKPNPLRWLCRQQPV